MAAVDTEEIAAPIQLLEASEDVCKIDKSLQSDEEILAPVDVTPVPRAVAS